MLRAGNLWYSRIAVRSNVELAIDRTLKKKKYGKKPAKFNAEKKFVINHRDEVVDFILDALLKRNYKFGEVKRFELNERGKMRTIRYLHYYPDTIYCQCILNVVQDIFINKYIRDTYSSIKGRGLQECVQRIQEAINEEVSLGYHPVVLQLDYRKCYDSIDHDIMLKILKEHIKDKFVIEFFVKLMALVDEGLAIGFSPNHYLVNLYLTGIDHTLKEVYHIKHYFRYMDDSLLILRSKAECFIMLRVIKELSKELKMEVKSNVRIAPLNYGFDYCGYVFYEDHTLIRKKIKISMKLKDKELRKSGADEKTYKMHMSAYFGWLKWCNSKNLIKTVFKEYSEFYINKLCDKGGSMEYNTLHIDQFWGLTNLDRVSITEYLDKKAVIICAAKMMRIGRDMQLIMKCVDPEDPTDKPFWMCTKSSNLKRVLVKQEDKPESGIYAEMLPLKCYIVSRLNSYGKQYYMLSDKLSR